MYTLIGMCVLLCCASLDMAKNETFKQPWRILITVKKIRGMLSKVKNVSSTILNLKNWQYVNNHK